MAHYALEPEWGLMAWYWLMRLAYKDLCQPVTTFDREIFRT